MLFFGSKLNIILFTLPGSPLRVKLFFFIRKKIVIISIDFDLFLLAEYHKNIDEYISGFISISYN